MTDASSDEIRRVWTSAKRLLCRSRRYWPVYVAGLLAAVVAGWAAPLLVPPMYRSAAVLVYRELIPTATLLGRDAAIESPRQRGARLRELLLARSNLEPLIDELGLYPDIVASHGKMQAVDELLERVDCRLGEDTFAIAFEYPDPEVVRDVTARLARSLIEQSATHRLNQARTTTEFLAAQREQVAKELVSKEQALATFLADHPEFAQDIMLTPGGVAPAGASIRAQERKAQTVNPAVQALERQRARVASRLASIDNEQSAIAMPQPVELDPEIARTLDAARRDYERARESLEDVTARFTSKHPDVRRAQARLATATAALDAARSAANESLPPARAIAAPATEADRADLTRQLANIRNAVAAAKSRNDTSVPSDSRWIVDLETEWAALNREVYEVRERHQQIERRYFQASILDRVESSGGAAHVEVVDPAFLPERPSRRGARRVAAVGALSMILLFAAVALGLTYLDDRLYDCDGVRALGLPGLVHAVPTRTGGKRRG